MDGVPFHRTEEAIGLAAFADLVLGEDGSESREPIRMTGLVVRAGGRRELRHFHGSIPVATP